MIDAGSTQYGAATLQILWPWGFLSTGSFVIMIGVCKTIGAIVNNKQAATPQMDD